MTNAGPHENQGVQYSAPIHTSASLEPRDPMDERAPMSLIDTRHDQMFPVLSIPQIEMARRFASAEVRPFAPGNLYSM